ncbi:hypothetical protein EDC94DRAFT_513163 [Helicostylum pulchrum]|nr:hypothetical protein EDC94DRAFT_513163 [Helicostylum pulchrum]
MTLLFVLTLETILVCITESFVIYYHSKIFAACQFSLNTIGLGQADFIYHGLYMATPIYQLCLYLDTLRQRNVFQLFTLVLFGGLMVIFSGIQTMQHMIFEQSGCDPWNQNSNNNITFPNTTLLSSLKMSVIISNTTLPVSIYQDTMDANISNIRPFEYSSLAFIILVFFIMLICVIKLYKLFHWNNYLFHTFAANDMRLRNAMISWAIFTGLLKIDFFFAFAYAIQLVPTALLGYTDIPLFEGALVFAVSFIAFLLAIHSIRNEDMRTLGVFNTIVLGSIGYFGYRLYTFGIHREIDPFMLTRYDLLFTTLVMTLLMILTLCTGLVCVRNVVLNKVRILQDFKCVCPTCYFHRSTGTESDTPQEPSNLEAASQNTVDLPSDNK